MRRILIIDDEADVREMLKVGFEEAGFEVMVASDGVSGLECYKQQTADLVITDILMPERDGLDLIQTLRVHDPSVKIIAISGKGKSGDLDFLLEAELFGAVRTLAKPFSWEEIFLTAQDVLALS